MPLALVLPLPAEVAARVALPASVPGALPASDLHVTVAALTSAPPDLLGSLAALAAHAAPLAATLSGTGRFASPAAEGDAFYLSVDAPALVELRARIESEHWRFIDRTHGLSPHVTLARLAPDDAAPIDRFGPEPVRFEALTLWDGDTRTAFPFGTAMDNTTTLDAVALPDTPPAELRLFRDGWNDTTKGRFLLDADGAAEVLRRFAAHGVELAMDFDHGTFTEGGRRRDVPGYIGGLDYRPGDGLHATALRWTEVGLRAIAPGRAPDGTPTVPEYRYVSPAIDFDPDTRRILGIKPVALVSYPATVGQRPLVMSAHSAPAPETRTMKILTALLGLAADADESTIAHAVKAAQTERDTLLGALGAKDIPAALGTVNALRTARERLDVVEKERAELSARVETAERAELVARGKREGKLTPALETFYAARPAAELSAFLEVAPVVLTPTQRQALPQPAPAAGLSVQGVPDKPFAELTAQEKERLLRTNRVAFEVSLAAHEAAGGDGTRYRTMLARLDAR